MRKRFALVGLACMLAAGIGGRAQAEVKHRFGAGARYWMAVSKVKPDNVDQEGVSWLLTYQLQPVSMLRIEADVEMMPESFGAFAAPGQDVYAPQVYLLVGMGLYAGVGAGTYYVDGEFWDKPFYGLRAGLDLMIVPHLYLDINGNYRFEKWNELNGQDISEDTVFLGAALRIEI